MPNEIYTMPGGLRSFNYQEITLVNNTAKTTVITVGLDEIWMIYGGYMVNGDSVARDMSVTLYDNNNKSIAKFLNYATAGAGTKSYFPVAPATPGILWTAFPIFAMQDYHIDYVWSAGGASAGGTAAIVLAVVRYP
jgi:hypothetical protein